MHNLHILSVYKKYSYFTRSFVVFHKWNNAWHDNMYVVGWYQDRWSICLYNLILFCYWFWKRPNVSLWFISLVFNWIMFSEVRSKIFAIRCIQTMKLYFRIFDLFLDSYSDLLGHKCSVQASNWFQWTWFTL